MRRAQCLDERCWRGEGAAGWNLGWARAGAARCSGCLRWPAGCARWQSSPRMGGCKDVHFVRAKLIWNQGFDSTWRAESQGRLQWWVHRHEPGGCLQGESARGGGRWRGAGGPLCRVVGGQAGRGQD